MLACSPLAPTAGNDAPAQGERATVRGYDLDLTERDGACAVSFSGAGRTGTVRLALAPPCRFVRRPDGPEVQTKSFPDAGDATVVIVAGTASDEPASVGPGVFCGSRSQALLLRRDGVATSARVARGRKCTSGEDPQEFWLFAH